MLKQFSGGGSGRPRAGLGRASDVPDTDSRRVRFPQSAKPSRVESRAPVRSKAKRKGKGRRHG